MLALVLVSTACGGLVIAQNQPFQTDTVYHQEFGCDSYLLSANSTVYHSDTVVKIPHYIAEGKNQLVIAVGCTGGRHRSVAVAEALYQALYRKDQAGIRLEHRDTRF